MKIKIRYENHITTLDIPEEEFEIMVRLDYEERLATADDPESIIERTPQEIMNERFNKPDYNNWHKFWRHIDENPVPPRLDHKIGYMARTRDEGAEPVQYTVEDFPDLTSPITQARRENYEEMCELIRKVLKPEYADMVIAIHLDAMKIAEYAELIGDKPNNVSHRLQRAEKKLKEIFEKRPI